MDESKNTELTLLEKRDYCHKRLLERYLFDYEKDDFTNESSLSVTSKESFLLEDDNFVDADFRDVSDASKHFWRKEVLDKQRNLVRSMARIKCNVGYVENSFESSYCLYARFENYSHHRDVSEMIILFKKDNGELLKLSNILSNSHNEGDYLLSQEFDMPLLVDSAIFSLTRDEIEFVAQATRFSVRFENVIANGDCYFEQRNLDEIDLLSRVGENLDAKTESLYKILSDEEEAAKKYETEKKEEQKDKESVSVELDSDDKKKKTEIKNAIMQNYGVNAKDWFSSMVELPDSDTRGKFYRIPNSIKVKSVVDAGFFDNPNLLQQYATSTANSGSKFMDAVANTISEVRQNNQIMEASDKSAAVSCLYVKQKDAENYYIDVMFFNMSYIRKCKYAVLSFDGNAYYSPELRHWDGSNKNNFYNLLTFKIPCSQVSASLSGKEAYLTFDPNDEDGSGVLITMKFSFNSDDFNAVDLIRVGDKTWTREMINEAYHSLYPVFAMKGIKDINFSNTEVLLSFLNNPFSFKEIEKYKNYCEESNRKSTFIDYCQEIIGDKKTDFYKIKKNLMDTLAKSKKGISRFILVYLLLELIGIPILISECYEYLGWYITFYTINVFATFFWCCSNYEDGKTVHYLSRKEADNRSGTYAFWGGFFVVAHIILAIILLASEEEYGPAGISLITLFVGICIAYPLSNAYSQSKVSKESSSFAKKIQSFKDKLN